MIDKDRIEALVERIQDTSLRQRVMVLWNGFVACQKAYIADASARNLRDMKASEAELERQVAEAERQYPAPEKHERGRRTKQKAPKIGELTEKQERFCQEYVLDLNGGEAAKRAGYRGKNRNVFDSISTENLGKPAISRRISELKALRAERLKIEADDVLRELWNLGTYSATEYFTWDASGNVTLKASDKLTKEQAKRISTIKQTRGQDGRQTIEMKFFDKVRPLELVGQHIGLFGEGGSPTSPDELVKMMLAYQDVVDATVPNPDAPPRVDPPPGKKAPQEPIVRAGGAENDDVPKVRH
jgi:phage terminase small subunit